MHAGDELQQAIETALQEQTRALIAGDWRGLGACLQQQEALMTQLARWTPSGQQVSGMRRLRRGAERNVELAQRLAARLARGLTANCPTPTYTRRARLGAAAQALLSLRG